MHQKLQDWPPDCTCLVRVNLLIRHLLASLLQLGAGGILLLAIADDSFLFLPVGNDLLTVILVARHHQRLLLYVAAGAAGSAMGVFLLDLVVRKGGEAGLKRLVKPKLLGYLKQKMEKHAAMVLIVACLAPPPFPFGAAIAAASAFQYPRPRSIFIGRLGGDLLRARDPAGRELAPGLVVHGRLYSVLPDRQRRLHRALDTHRPFQGNCAPSARVLNSRW